MPESATDVPKEGVTEEDAASSAGRVLAGVLDLPGLAGVAESLVVPLSKALLALTAPLDAISPLGGVARKMLGVAVSQAAREEPSVREVLVRDSETPERAQTTRADPSPPPWPKLISDLVEELAEHAAADDWELRRTARSALKELGVQMAGLHAVALPGPGSRGPSKDAAQRVAREIAKRLAKMDRILDQMEKLFGKVSAPKFRFALKLFGAELQSVAIDRAAIAAALAVPGFLADLAVGGGVAGKESPSTLDIGREVEQHLQREYRSFWVSPRFVGRGTNGFVRGAVVQDNVVFYNAMNGVSLASAAKSRSDGSLHALLFARLPSYLTQQFMGGVPMDRVWSLYREDVLDMRCGEVWEIKPMRSAAIGVIQELQYRHSFNLVNALMLDVRDVIASGPVKGLLAKRVKFFKGIAYFSREVPLVPGSAANWTPIRRAFRVGQSQGRSLLAVPLTVLQLPGLVLYVLLELPTEAVLALSTVLAKAIADAIERKAREFADQIERVIRVIAEVALAALCALAMLAVPVLFWLALPTASAAGIAEGITALAALLARFAPALAAGALPAPQSLLELARESKLTLLAPPALIGDELVMQLAPVEQRGNASHIPAIDIAIGNVRVCGLPVAARPIVDALAGMGAAIGAGVFAEFVGQETAQV